MASFILFRIFNSRLDIPVLVCNKKRNEIVAFEVRDCVWVDLGNENVQSTLSMYFDNKHSKLSLLSRYNLMQFVLSFNVRNWIKISLKQGFPD